MPHERVGRSRTGPFKGVTVIVKVPEGGKGLKQTEAWELGRECSAPARWSGQGASK